jgi:hypothetical protein
VEQELTPDASHGPHTRSGFAGKADRGEDLEDLLFRFIFREGRKTLT